MSISSQKKKLWKVFATYIKNRDKWTCVTCGKQAYGQGMNAGHYIAKGACSAEYYFHERNVHAQCAYCNLALEGNRPAYRKFIMSKYGEDVLNDLENNYRGASKDYPYEEKTCYYEKLNKNF